MHVRREVTKDRKHLVTIGFFEPKEQQDMGCFANCVNSIAASWTAREGLTYSHVEMRFSDGIVTSVTQNTPVHLERRVLSNPNYKSFFRIAVAPDKERKMKLLAEKYHKEEVRFNTGGMWWNFIPLLKYIPLQRGGRSVFCSEYMVQLLQEADFLLAIRPESTSPNDLYVELKMMPEAKLGINTVLYEKQGGVNKKLSMRGLSESIKPGSIKNL